MDSEITETVNKVPYLGDIPILGRFFRSTEARENQTELLVLVTPSSCGPPMQMPEMPTGELDSGPGVTSCSGPSPPSSSPGTRRGRVRRFSGVR
jgi:hypothetical protein